MGTVNLTKTEIVELTQKKQYSAQIRQLEHMNISYLRRMDGSPCVLRYIVSQPANDASYTPKVVLDFEGLED